MADAKKCDICKEYYDPYNLRALAGINAIAELRTDAFGSIDFQHTIEMCPDCMELFREWLSEMREE